MVQLLVRVRCRHLTALLLLILARVAKVADTDSLLRLLLQMGVLRGGIHTVDGICRLEIGKTTAAVKLCHRERWCDRPVVLMSANQLRGVAAHGHLLTARYLRSVQSGVQAQSLVLPARK